MHGSPTPTTAHSARERTPEWELFDPEEDPAELHNLYDDPAYAVLAKELTEQLYRLKEQVGDDA